MAFEQVRYRPLASRVLAALTVVVCAIGVVSLVALDVMDAVRYGWGLALVAVLVWAMFWRPELIVEEHGITVVPLQVGASTLVRFASLDAIDVVVTDAEPDASIATALDAAGTEVHVA